MNKKKKPLTEEEQQRVDLHNEIRNYLKDNLRISIGTNGSEINVKLILDDKEISEATDYLSLPTIRASYSE